MAVQYSGDYAENSSSAILRLAIFVAVADESWHKLERERLEHTYLDVCRRLDVENDDAASLRELNRVAEEVPDEIRKLSSKEERDTYLGKCMAPILSKDVQQIAVGAALRVAGGDSELQPREVSTIWRICKEWGIDPKDAV